jgi:hypothetical protein
MRVPVRRVYVVRTLEPVSWNARVPDAMRDGIQVRASSNVGIDPTS